MRVRVLGGFDVEGVAEHDLGSRKARRLLKLLVLARGRSVAVDRIADVLWDDALPARPIDQIAVLVSRLRAVVGTPRITRADVGYALAVDWLDVDEVARLGDVASDALAGHRLGAARAAAGAALALARGPLLPGEDGTWVEPEREAARSAVTRVLRVAVDAAIDTGDHGAATALAEQALLDDPYDEAMLRALMGAHLAAGRPGSALAAYGRARHRLAEDLGVAPTAETQTVHAEALRVTEATAATAPPESAPTSATRAPVAGLVGRADELAALDAALDSARAGATAVVLIEGDAGIGKTFLVDGWSGGIGSEVAVLRGRCDELGRDLPLQPVADALAGHLRAIGTEAAATVLGDEAVTLAPLLGTIPGSTATVLADPAASQARLFSALTAVVDRVGGDRPTVLIVEDLHLAGASTRAWLTFAERRVRRLLLLVTSRRGGAAGIDAGYRIVLGPLERADVVELVGIDRADELLARSGGLPLLLAALAASSAALGSDVATVRDVVVERVNTLGQALAGTLRVAAVLGGDCDLDLLAHITAAPVVDVLAHLEAAENVGLIVERGGRFAFHHELVREALELDTSAPRRALVHRHAARALAARFPVDQLAVAVHARAGGDLNLAAASLVAAAEAAAARFDVETAEEHLADALALAPSASAYVQRARVRMSRQAFGDAAADAEEAITRGGGAAALEAAGWIAYYRRRYDEAQAFADEAAARAGDDAVRVSALALAGRVRHGAGDLAGAVECLSSATDGPPAVRGIADVYLALAQVHQGRPADALVTLAGPMVDPDSLAHAWAPLHLRFARALALGQLGRVVEAVDVADELAAAVRREGRVGARFTAIPANTKGWLLRWSGCGDEADERNIEAFEATGGDGGPSADTLAEAHFVAVLDLADGAVLRGDPARASELAARVAALDTWHGTMAWHQRHRFGLLRAKLALAAGDTTAAAGLAGAVAADAAARGAGRYELLARAIVGVADPAVLAAELDQVVTGLGRCAVVDGWPLVAALAAARGVDRWRAEAERLAAIVVAGAGDHADAARRFVAARLTAASAR